MRDIESVDNGEVMERNFCVGEPAVTQTNIVVFARREEKGKSLCIM